MLGYEGNALADNNAISPNHCIVEVDLNDGRMLSVYAQYPLGAEPNAMTEEQFIAKLRTCAEALSETEKDALVSWILKLDEVAAL